MNSALIREAADHLNIDSLSLAAHTARVSPEFNPLVEPGPTFVNLSWGPERAALATLGNDKEKVRQWQVLFGTKARVIAGSEEELTQEQIADPKRLVAEMAAVFLIQYRVREGWEINREALKEFTQHNVAIHVWPFWREWLHSTAQRMGLPQMMLTMHMLPPAGGGAAELKEQPAEAATPG